MDANDFKFSRSSYAIESAGSSVTSRVQRSSPQWHSPERTEAAPTPIPEGPGEAQHAGSPPQPRTSPQTEGDAAYAGVNQFGTNVHVLESKEPSPFDIGRTEANPNWKQVETDTEWENQLRNRSEPENVEEEEGFQETLCSPPGASRYESHPDVEIVSSAPSEPVVPIKKLSSNDEMEKPHESDDDDEEESTPFVQTETKPLKLPSGSSSRSRRTTSGWRRRSKRDGLREEPLGKQRKRR